MKVLKSQLRQIVSSKAGEFLIDKLEKRIDELYKERAELLIPGEAQKTQETRMHILGVEKAFQDIIEVLKMNDVALEFMFGEDIVDDEGETD